MKALHRRLDFDGLMFAARLDDAFNHLAGLELNNPGPGEYRINSRTRFTFDWAKRHYVGIDRKTAAQRCARYVCFPAPRILEVCHLTLNPFNPILRLNKGLSVLKTILPLVQAFLN